MDVWRAARTSSSIGAAAGPRFFSGMPGYKTPGEAEY
jgi:hypothetical protein